jgi:hypothetical protein
MKLLFLDHQGVMRLLPNPTPGILVPFDKAAVAELNCILLADMDIQIVVSSDWKCWVELADMQQFYLDQGIVRAPIAYTPHIKRNSPYPQHRAGEIREFLDGHICTAPTTWTAIDDLDMRQWVKNFIWIDTPAEGIVGRAAEILKMMA